MRYKALIPPPKANRMVGRPKKVIVNFFGGFDGYERKEEHIVDPETTEFDFEVPNNVRQPHQSTVMGGDYFSISVEYTNESGSRKERYLLGLEEIP
jgi:hypothetical protein